MRSGRHVWLAGALLAPALIVSGVVPSASAKGGGRVVKAGDVFFEHDFGSSSEVAQLSGGIVTDLATGIEPDVSADGSRVAFVGIVGFNEPLEVMNSDGSDVTQIDFPSTNNTTDNIIDGYPRWSPDGQWIVFAKEETGQHAQIFKVRPDGTDLTQLTHDTDYAASIWPGWSPDGSKIVYTYNSNGSNIYRLYIMNADGSNAHPVDASGGGGESQCWPDWSADGSRIYYAKWNGDGCTADSNELSYYTSPDSFTGTDATSNTFDGGTVDGAMPRVSADGSTLYYMGTDSNGHYQLYSVSTNGTGRPTQLTSDVAVHTNPSPVGEAWPNSNTKIIVALGDSIAAGEGINYRFTWTGTGWVRTGPSKPGWMNTRSALGANYQQCHQSGLGYPNLIALTGGDYQVYNMACTGASALQNNTSGIPEDGGVLDPEQFNSKDQPYPEHPGPSDPSKSVPAQLGGISNCSECSSLNKYFSKHNPNIVLLTMGANDLDFPYWIKKCYLPTDCNTKAHTNLVDSQLAIEKADLVTTLSQLNAWASSKRKNLQVLVTDYYSPFDTSNMSCADYQWGGVQLLKPDEVTWLQNGLNQINSNINADVTQALGVDTSLTVSLVDLSGNYGGTDVMSGHKWCSADPWVYGTSIDYGIPPGSNPAPFHPTPEGQNAIYQAVNAVLNSPA
jgi:hypothetical protein